MCAVLAVFTLALLTVEVLSERNYKKAILSSRLEGYADVVAAAPDSLVLQGLLPPGIRLTVLDSLGKVLYDSDNDASAMENHIQRPEIAELLGGKASASSIRTSSTSGTDYIYYARRCGENIVRTAMPFEVAERRFLHPDWLVLLSIFLLFTASLPLFLLISKRFNAEADFKLKKQKKQMTNNIAHELRTPVTSIRAYLETLENNPGLPDEKQRAFIDRAYRQSIRLSDMIRDISLITKMEDAPQSLTTTYLGLRRISELVAEELGPDLEKRSMKLENLIPEELSIKANESLVYAIYRNLLENSIRYAGEGSVVRMGGKLSADGYAHLYFEDNGVGVDPRHLERIFERFYRVFDPKGGQAEGSGLGLSIVRNAVAFHGGSIKASSEKGRGLRFDFSLRLLTVPNGEADI